MDRSVRPMLQAVSETQLLLWVLSYDGSRDPEPLALCAAGAALAISDVPMKNVVAGVKVGKVCLRCCAVGTHKGTKYMRVVLFRGQ